jgi:LacI family transcriptional regulator, purine nucleotide synthesis repressor
MGKTIYDVAKEAGVSIATVSKVINGNGRISEKTIQKVKGVMKELNYQPSTIASALTSKRTHILGVIVPNIANPFFGEVTRIIEKYAHENGYTTMVCSTYNDIAREIHNIQLFLRQQVDGMIIATEQIDNEELNRLNSRGIPIVKFSALSDSTKMLGISTENFVGGQLAANYLFSNGHRNIWIVGEQNRYSEQQRIAGFRSFFAEKGFPIREDCIFHSDTEYEEAIEMAKRILKQPNLPTAMFVTTDFVALVIMNIAKQLGIQIPEDLSIIGFDNTIYAQLNYPQLTTVAQSVNKMGKHAVTSLIEMIEGIKTAPYDVAYFKPQIIERATVKRLEE